MPIFTASRFLFVTACLVLFFYPDCHAWVYPEHRFIARLAIEQLDASRREKLDSVWSIARQGHEDRLSSQLLDTTLGRKPDHLDYASWPAIAGDHSCSSADMLHTILYAPWILKVSDVAARLEDELARARRHSKRINAIRDSDIRLQRADPNYATRAGSNNAHFLLPRSSPETTAARYFGESLASGTALNALGVYAYYHAKGTAKASRAAACPPEGRPALLLAALADEAFALHFLEDVFAAGHIAGTRGSASLRKGTHDYYNEHGLEITTWNGQRTVVFGDAYMTPNDADFAAACIQKSLEEFIAAFDVGMPCDPGSAWEADTFNVCIHDTLMTMAGEPLVADSLLYHTPVPGLSSGGGELPRFNAEMGLFVGLSAGTQAVGVSGGFGENQTDPGAVGGIGFGFRVGFGMDGVLNEAGDGLIFLQASLQKEGNSTNQIVNISGTGLPQGALTSAIPGRQAYAFRMRMPFYLLPGDLLVAGPILALVSRKALNKVAVAAGNGGLIPWQSGIATPIGRFQFVLGREINVTLYGTNKHAGDATLIPVGNELYWVQYRSTKLEFPYLEYRPFRFFTASQASSLLIQFSVGVDVPHHASTLLPEGRAVPPMKSVVVAGFRIVFDWRYYL